MKLKTKIDKAFWTYNVRPEEILYAAQSADYTMVHLPNGKRLRVLGTLDEFHKKAPHLLRIHRGYLINPDAVRAYTIETETNNIHFLFRDEVTHLFMGKPQKELLSKLTEQW
jgi:DNA-binding LytR/AlgR family response regulator